MLISGPQRVRERANASLTNLPLDSMPVAFERPTALRVRAKLWDLNATLHCSVIGTCLSTAELRKVMGKIIGADITRCTDHDLHGQAVGLCSQHNALSKLLQKALDQRHETAIRRFAKLQGEAVILEHWNEAIRAGDIPGAYWAALTHPDLGPAGMRTVFGDVHMLSHLVGAANRADIRRLAVLEAENAALRDTVECQQTKVHDIIMSKDEAIRQMSASAAQRVHDMPQADPDDDAILGLRRLVSDLEGRLARECGRRAQLEASAADHDAERKRLAVQSETAQARLVVLERELAALQTHLQARKHAEPAALFAPHIVLYVGGRPACIPQIRAFIESSGGALLVHDGGMHDHTSLVAGLISQADHVVFPVDCISHEAALMVKRLCKQMKKPWNPLRTSSFSSFLAAIAEPLMENVT